MYINFNYYYFASKRRRSISKDRFPSWSANDKNARIDCIKNYSTIS